MRTAMDYCAKSIGFRVNEEHRTIQVIWQGPERAWNGLGEPKQYPLNAEEIPGDLFRREAPWALTWISLKLEQQAVYRELLNVVGTVTPS